MSIQSVLNVVYLAAGLLVAVLIHEYAHAWVAVRLGDRTPKLHGRLTVDPRRHLDPFGSYILPAITLLPILFGKEMFFPVFAYAKPQEVNPWSLRKPDRDVVLIALAGPAANVFLAAVFGALFRAACGAQQVARAAAAFTVVNVIMAVIHVVPLPPFDGSRILARFLPSRAREVYVSWEPYGALFVIVIFFIFAGPVTGFVNAVGGGLLDAVTGKGCPATTFLH
ncbi:MAG: site-2 protease family protein [Actinobacteria bacterium]|nr:MAG: site-2 protease family protein [Actinomycetota bacterium]